MIWRRHGRTTHAALEAELRRAAPELLPSVDHLVEEHLDRILAEQVRLRLAGVVGVQRPDRSQRGARRHLLVPMVLVVLLLVPTLAVAGQLPAPLQDLAARVADAVGLDVPTASGSTLDSQRRQAEHLVEDRRAGGLDGYGAAERRDAGNANGGSGTGGGGSAEPAVDSDAPDEGGTRDRSTSTTDAGTGTGTSTGGSGGADSTGTGGTPDAGTTAPVKDPKLPKDPKPGTGVGTGGAANGNGNGNGAANGSGTANGAGNGNANGSSNGNANGAGNGNANGAGNGNANGNGAGNGNANGADKGDGGGSANGNAGGKPPKSA